MDRIEIDDFTYIDILNLSDGHYNPITNFMGYNDLDSVLNEMLLESGALWSMPILLNLKKDEYDAVSEGATIALEHKGKRIAKFYIEERFQYDPKRLIKSLLGTEDTNHPGAKMILLRNPGFYLSGQLSDVVFPESQIPVPNPKEVKATLNKRGWKTVAAFQTRNVPHIGHEHVQKYALEAVDGLLISPILGKKKTGDFTDEAIRSSYETLFTHYHDSKRVLLSFLRLNILYSGPKETIFHALVRKNLGCTHFIVGRDHAGVGDYYAPYEAQELAMSTEGLGIEVIPVKEVLNCKRCGITLTNQCPHGPENHSRFKGTDIREALKTNRPVTSLRDEVFEEIKKFKNPF
ncbi:MAG: sulfate adenylyltransferase, partial [bacterium]|nr:sulfate adenylyltransferase [bacterium]